MNMTAYSILFGSLMSVCFFFLFLGSILILGYTVLNRKYGLGILLLPLTIVNYLMIQFFIMIINQDPENSLLTFTVGLFSGVPKWAFFLFIIIDLIILVLLFRYLWIWRRTHLSDMSVKQALDTLPVGVVCYDEDGFLHLRNDTMERIFVMMTGEALMNGCDLERRIEDRDEEAECDFLTIGDRTAAVFTSCAYVFSKEKIHDGSRTLTVLTAYDISEEYRKTKTLRRQQELMEELNRKLRAYNREIVSIISNREVLNAKVRIHDELGAMLLQSKLYLKNGGSEKERENIIGKLRSNIEFLRQEASEEKLDEYEMILQTAEKLNVGIEVQGELPSEGRNRNILTTAIHECLTNTLRHAHGDRLRMAVTYSDAEIKAVFSNNGIAPTEPVREIGGLRSLRNLLEQAGGSMTTEIEGGFRLTLTLPLQEETYGLSMAVNEEDKYGL